MNSRANSTYRMLTTVASTIESNKTLKAVTDLPALLNAHTDLTETNAEIAALMESTATPAGPSPESTVKRSLLTDAVESCAELAAAVHAYAVDNADPELAAKSNYSESSLGSGVGADHALADSVLTRPKQQPISVVTLLPDESSDALPQATSTAVPCVSRLLAGSPPPS